MAQFRNTRLAGDRDKNGKLRPPSNNTVRLELALLGHLFTVTIKKWGMMVTAGRTNHMIAGNTIWSPAYREHLLQNMGKN